MPEASDEQLITDYLEGNEKSLEILIQRYLKPIYGFVYRYIGDAHQAEDITQDVFVRVWRNLKKPALHRIYSGAGFDSKKGSFKTWIFSIAKNASIDFLKKKKSIPFSEFEDAEGNNAFIDALSDPAPLALEIFERKDLGYILTSALEKLLPKYRMILFLYYNDHFTFREIADSLGESLNTVKSRHRRALLMLKKLISDSL